jgi:hypothetical protein
MKYIIKISADFTTCPGARYYSDGPFSGEEFFDKLLSAKFGESLSSREKLTVDLDGTEGYATSFLDEAFSRLAKKYNPKTVWDNLILISSEEPDWIDEIKTYIFDGEGVD